MGRSPRQLLRGEWPRDHLPEADPRLRAVAARLKPSPGTARRVWSLSRPLTHRWVDLLTGREYIHAISSEPGDAGPNRTILAATRTGRSELRTWLDTPVAHLHDLRSGLLLKLVLAENCDVDVTDVLDRQRAHIDRLASTLAERGSNGTDDVVAIWRLEASRAATRFLDQIRT